MPQLGEHAFLIVVSGPCLGRRVLLGEHPVEIGRGMRCPLLIEADSVSRRHAVVEWSDGAHRVTDLGSTNGTFVNEKRVAGASLADGDRVQVGNVLLKYIAGGNVEGAYHEEIQRLMRFDGLTGAANRGHFEDALRTAVIRARQSAEPIGLLLLDLDHFKAVNDTWGHPVGDSVLRQTAELLARGLGSNQLLARVGGEEFAVLWPGADLAALRSLAEALRSSVAKEEWQASGHRIRLTISIGAAARPAGSTELPGQLYEQADARLYEAKRAGRDCVR